ncbi:conjugal transfer protein TraN [Vibrio aestuarianus]|uniref:conjugal transfer protein TraN n=1 Tax=Vibrio aestuarianus TaxID=28171 RepID=UPI00237C90F5|nr:conjugal transfer protein TraN [Vibrio aestuarianus]MDE1315495.1 conjugal transfer protein TraN [Vibrio aestuarianus]
MFKKITSTILILCYLLTSLSVNANPYYEAVHCFDERVDNPQEGDIAKCQTGNNGAFLCPINSVACSTRNDTTTVSPTYSCSSGTLQGTKCKVNTTECRYDGRNYIRIVTSNSSNCSVSGAGYRWDGQYASTNNYFQGSYVSSGSIGKCKGSQSWKNYQICRNTIAYINASPKCPSGYTYKSSTGLCEKSISVNVCPLGGQYQCIPNGGASYCSPNTCFNPNEDKEVIDDQIDGSMLENNGATDDSGMCLDQVYIFSGRAQKCRPNGVQTAFKDCCATDGKVLKDSSGSSAQTEMYTQSINAVYQASAAAYQAYAAGATAAEASSAFSSAFVGAFDPTSLAIAVAIAIVMDYLAKACDQIETETAIANSSGRCVDLGEFCKEKWLGKCVQKQRSFCCFNSQLAKIINEQGRLQLKAFQNLPNRGFGDRGNPQCRGFTPEEFQALDFSNIDLTEYYEELIHKSQAEIESTMEQMTAEHFNNVQ